MGVILREGGGYNGIMTWNGLDVCVCKVIWSCVLEHNLLFWLSHYAAPFPFLSLLVPFKIILQVLVSSLYISPLSLHLLSQRISRNGCQSENIDYIRWNFFLSVFWRQAGKQLGESIGPNWRPENITINKGHKNDAQLSLQLLIPITSLQALLLSLPPVSCLLISVACPG